MLVDSVVTDKHGSYIRDLTQKDFRVWEDDKEQQVAVAKCVLGRALYLRAHLCLACSENAARVP